jgi:hypothetical protein
VIGDNSCQRWPRDFDAKVPILVDAVAPVDLGTILSHSDLGLSTRDEWK